MLAVLIPQSDIYNTPHDRGSQAEENGPIWFAKLMEPQRQLEGTSRLSRLQPRLLLIQKNSDRGRVWSDHGKQFSIDSEKILANLQVAHGVEVVLYKQSVQ